MKALENRADIVNLVDTFYKKVLQNELLEHIFQDVAKVDWEHHLPKMYDFWETLLLGKEAFKGNPMLVHILLSKKTPMTESQFNAWLSIWVETVDNLFEGEKALESKQKARNIAGLMLHKIQNN